VFIVISIIILLWLDILLPQKYNFFSSHSTLRTTQWRFVARQDPTNGHEKAFFSEIFSTSATE
jgi:hypothetical protein